MMTQRILLPAARKSILSILYALLKTGQCIFKPSGQLRKTTVIYFEQMNFNKKVYKNVRNLNKYILETKIIMSNTGHRQRRQT